MPQCAGKCQLRFEKTIAKEQTNKKKDSTPKRFEERRLKIRISPKRRRNSPINQIASIACTLVTRSTPVLRAEKALLRCNLGLVRLGQAVEMVCVRTAVAEV